MCWGVPAEATTGDLPTSVKYSPAMKHASANLESEISAEMLALLPAGLRPALKKLNIGADSGQGGYENT